jgi:hypothetical protein
MSKIALPSSSQLSPPIQLQSYKTLSIGGAFRNAIAGNDTCEAEAVKPKKATCDTEPNYIEQSEQSLFSNKAFDELKRNTNYTKGYKLISASEEKNGIHVEVLSNPNKLKIKLKNADSPQKVFGFFNIKTPKPVYLVVISKDGSITLIFNPKKDEFYTKSFRGSGSLDFKNAITIDKVNITNGSNKISVQDAMIEAGFINKCKNNFGFGGWCLERDPLDKPLKVK